MAKIKICKRDGRRVDFDPRKIETAVLAAFKQVDGEISKYALEKAENISDYILDFAESADHLLSVEEIQDMVENGLMSTKRKDVAKSYIKYREDRNRARENTIDKLVDEIVHLENDYFLYENSNKDATLATTMRDYIAGAVSTDKTKRQYLPKEIVEAHEKGIIHFHDADYFIQPIHNCLDVNTKFITNKGVKTFNDFEDGDETIVLTKDGNWKKAVVKNYGTDKLYKYTFYNGKKSLTHEVLATEDHRWYLKDGTVTTNLKVGDKLVKAPVIYNQDLDYDKFSEDEKLMWCKGFAMGDGTVEFNGAGNHINSTRIRLCGEKDNQWLDRFNIEGCKIRSQIFENGDHSVVVYNYHKETPEFDNVNQIRAFFNGLYCADGKMAINNPHSRTYRIQSSNKKIIDFIREYAPVAGLYITRENDLTGEKTNFTGEEGRKYTILFSFNPNFHFTYTVLDKEYVKEDTVWCLEVEDEHNFVLANGIVTGNCDLINLEDMLWNGTVISKTYIDTPHKFSTACNIATQVIAQVASSQYGGQSISLAHLSAFIKETRKTFKKKFPTFSEEQIEKMVEEDIKAGIQTLQYQILTLMTTNGQAPFITVYMNLGEVEEGPEREDLAKAIKEVLNQRIQGVKNETGTYITPAFPKLIYALDDFNVPKDSKYYYLTELAAECTAKRMVPDYISNKVQRELKNGDTYTCMGCRSFLTPDRTTKNYAKALNYDKYAGHKYYGRFNSGVVTINLPYIACLSNGDMDRFWGVFDTYLELCHLALKCRHKRLHGVPSDVAPILWQYGALARLEKGETIDELLYHGYSTISLGYAGLYEMCVRMTGKSHTDPEGKKFALDVMQYMNDKCALWKAQEDIDYSIYGTPLESTTYKFAKALQRDFGTIENVSDHDYITNSYHVCVREDIDAFSKLAFESEFQKLSPGGAISYIEVPDMQNNIPAILSVINFIYNNIMYAEINTKSDYCQVCGWNGEIVIEKDENGKLFWKCPNCGNNDQKKMNVARRTCGYIGTNFWNQGRTQEIAERKLHL